MRFFFFEKKLNVFAGGWFIIFVFKYRFFFISARLLEEQIAEKAESQALQRASGGMDSAERILNRTLLLRAAVTLGLSSGPGTTPLQRAQDK